MTIARRWTAGQNSNIRISNRSFENDAKFQYLEKTLTDQNYRHENTKNRLNSGVLVTIHFKIFRILLHYP
jgi:hypothetical protein